MESFICKTCGTQYPPADSPPGKCPICLDPRQYLRPEGQQWTTLEEMRTSHRSLLRPLEARLTGIGVEPSFAIGQRALLVETPEGNLLWDCLSLLDDEAVASISDKGGLSGIAISHPHFYGAMVDWAQCFDCSIHIHESERGHVMRQSGRVQFWTGETSPLFGNLTLIRCGGHFDGGQVLHWPAGADGHGCLLTGDTITVVPDSRWVSFMYSYPNLIPLPPAKVKRIVDMVTPFRFDRIYGGWWDRVMDRGARNAVTRSADRYIAALEGRYP